MADLEGNSNVKELIFTPTMELRYLHIMVPYMIIVEGTAPVYREILQQKWINKLGDEEWRDVPTVINETTK